MIKDHSVSLFSNILGANHSNHMCSSMKLLLPAQKEQEGFFVTNEQEIIQINLNRFDINSTLLLQNQGMVINYDNESYFASFFINIWYF